MNRIRTGKYDLIIFTSPSGFNNFKSLISKNTLQKIKIASIGTTTSMAINQSGINPKITASKPNSNQLIQDIIQYLKNN